LNIQGKGGPVPPQAGFTLIEVLAALAVAAIAFTVLLQTDALSHREAIRSRARLGAVRLAGALLADVFASGVPSLSEEKGGEGAYEWSRTATETPFPGVREVAITTFWTEGGERQTYRVAAYLPE
jgi:prepilin-type N-terminal cleavage/methylation domain-containing protein